MDDLGLEALDRKLKNTFSFKYTEPDFLKTKSRNNNNKKRNTVTPTRKYKNRNPRRTRTKPHHAQDIANTKKLINSTGSAFGSLIDKIKDRKIRKLEKEAEAKTKKAQALAHKIKTLQVIQDQDLDIVRYERELEKLEKEMAPPKIPKEEEEA